MKLAPVRPGDLIEVDKRGRRMFGKVVEIEDAVVRFEPLCPGVSYRHASPREIVGHWRKAGRRGRGATAESSPEDERVQERDQLALGIEAQR